MCKTFYLVNTLYHYLDNFPKFSVNLLLNTFYSFSKCLYKKKSVIQY